MHEYMTRNVVRMESATDKLTSSIRSFVAEIEREKTSARTREDHLNKARRGLVTGGKIYGYRNVRRDDGVHWELDEAEAKVVREVFERYAEGDGLRTIAHDLNDRGVKAPRKYWSPGSIQPMLRRARYNGWLLWGEHHKIYKLATKVRVMQEPEVSQKAEHLRIVPKKLWNAVQVRINAQAKLARTSSTARGRSASRPCAAACSSVESAAALSGSNGRSGAPRSRAKRKSILVYFCQRHRRSGPAACSNAARRPVEIVDTLISKWIRANIFSDDFVQACERDVRKRQSLRKPATVDVSSWQKEPSKVKAEIGKLSAALLRADAKPDAVVRMIAEREARLASLESRISCAKVAPETVDAEARAMVETAIGRIRAMRESWPWSPEAGRSFLQGSWTAASS